MKASSQEDDGDWVKIMCWFLVAALAKDIASPCALCVKVLFFTLKFLFKYHLFTFKYTHLIIFKVQEYLCLTILEKPIIQVHGNSFIQNLILISNINAKFLLAISKPNSYWQHQNPILIGNIKTQFLLATLKLNSLWQHQSLIPIGNIKTQFLLATSKPNSHWQYQSSILIGNMKAQFLLATSKPNSHWQYQSSIHIDNIKSPTYVGTIKNPS